MKTLNQLIRLHHYKLLGRQKDLAKLEAEASELKRKSEMLDTEALVEEVRAEESLFGIAAFAPYFARVKQRRFALNEERGALHQRVLGARTALKGAFAELKRIEILRDQKAVEAKVAENKAEQAALDEVAIRQHGRGE